MLNMINLRDSLLISQGILWSSVLLSHGAMASSPPLGEIEARAKSPQPQATKVTLAAEKGASDPLITQALPNPTQAESTLPGASKESRPLANPSRKRLSVPSVSNLEQPSRETPVKSFKRAMPQVTSVSELSDVRPTDWAFQAVQSLVERYGCIEGYPDKTFRGSRAATRYELAAALNACLNQISAQLGGLTPEDLATIKRLQDEFAAELATLRGRVDALEARTTELEANQFSTTTKLNALVWFNATGATIGNGVLQRETGVRADDGTPTVVTVEDNPNITLSNYLFLTLNTSFTGKDTLTTQLVAGNGSSPANVFASAGLFNTFGVPITDQTGVVGGANSVNVRELNYSFPVTDNIQAVVGPRINWYRYFDNNRFTNFVTGASSFNSSGSTLVNAIDRGAGAAILFDFSKQFEFRVAYLAENTEFLPNPPFNSASRIDQGLFDGTNTLSAELTLSPSDTFNLRLLYNRTNIQQINGLIGGAIGEPIYGLADDGFGGPLNNASADTFGVNFDWLITSGFGIFGRYTFGSTNIDPATAGIEGGKVNAQSYQAGVAFPDLIKEGALATISYVVPFSVTDGSEFLVSGFGNGGKQSEIEASYYFPVTDNIAIVPAFYAILNPNNFSDNPTIYVGNLRTQFSF